MCPSFSFLQAFCACRLLFVLTPLFFDPAYGFHFQRRSWKMSPSWNKPRFSNQLLIDLFSIHRQLSHAISTHLSTHPITSSCLSPSYQSDGSELTIVSKLTGRTSCILQAWALVVVLEKRKQSNSFIHIRFSSSYRNLVHRCYTSKDTSRHLLQILALTSWYCSSRHHVFLYFPHPAFLSSYPLWTISSEPLTHV